MANINRKLLFSVTREDCKWDYFRCPGKGGQNVNKRDTGVRCTHSPSGAVGKSCDERNQGQNKKTAFIRMANSKEFKNWHKIECARRTGQLDLIEREVERQMRNIKVEVKENGVWTEVNKDDPLSCND